MGQPASLCEPNSTEILQWVNLHKTNDAERLKLGLMSRYSVTQQDVLQSDANGLQPWCKRALAGRGVLIDYAAYAERHNISVGHFGPHPVTLQDVQTIAKDQGVEFRTGDVLFLRTGYVRAYQALVTREEREKVASVKHWCGLGQGRDMTEWLWERQFAAVASDTPGFEVKRESCV